MDAQNTKKIPKILVSKFIFICKAVGLRIDCFFLPELTKMERKNMNKLVKRLLTGTPALAIILTALSIEKNKMHH